MDDFKERKDRAKSASRVEDVARDLGLDVKRGKCRCPSGTHEDKNPSFSVSSSKQIAKCFACGAGGDVIALVQLVRRCDFNEALRFLEERAGLSSGTSSSKGKPGSAPALAPAAVTAPVAPSRPPPTIPAAPATDPEEVERLRDDSATHELLGQLTPHFHRRLSECPEALEYLSNRRLYAPDLVRHFCVGYDDGSAAEALPEAARAVLAKVGYLNAKGNSAFYRMVTVPLWRGEKVVGLYGRRIDATEPIHRYLAGSHRGVVNPMALLGSSELVLAETPLDALSLWRMGSRNVTATYGALGYARELVETIKEQVKVLYLAQDRDKGGEAGVAKAVEIFTPSGIVCRRVRLPEGTKDTNELLVSYGEKSGREVTLRLLEEAVPLSGSVPTAGNPYEGMLTFREGRGQFHYGGVYYQVWPIPLGGKDGELRVVVVAERNAARHNHRFDLYNDLACTTFSTKGGQKLEVQPARIGEDLSKITREIEALRTRHRNGHAKVAGPEAAAGMTSSDRERAIAFLKDRRLLERIAADFDALGYVGEQKAKVAAYLVATSRKMEQPLGAVIRSSSASGKTRLMEKVAALVPPDEVEYLSRISSKALYNLPDDYLNGRLLILDEAVGGDADVQYSIRQILSRRTLSAAITQANPATGQLETLIFHKEAHAAYIEGTTATDCANPENENRVFVLSLDESPEQTKRIHEAQRNGYKRKVWERERARDEIVSLHHHSQKLLRPMRVDIPYVDLIEFPDQWLRARRDNERFLALVATVAFLFQYQRPVGADTSCGDLFVTAAVDDYAVAYDLAYELLVEGLSELGKAHRELLAKIESMVKERSKAAGVRVEDYQFTRADIREYTGWPHHRVRDLIGRLEELEVLEVIVAPTRGRQAVYRLRGMGASGKNPLAGLPSPEEIRRKWKDCNGK